MSSFGNEISPSEPTPEAYPLPIPEIEIIKSLLPPPEGQKPEVLAEFLLHLSSDSPFAYLASVINALMARKLIKPPIMGRRMFLQIASSKTSKPPETDPLGLNMPLWVKERAHDNIDGTDIKFAQIDLARKDKKEAVALLDDVLETGYALVYGTHQKAVAIIRPDLPITGDRNLVIRPKYQEGESKSSLYFTSTQVVVNKIQKGSGLVEIY